METQSERKIRTKEKESEATVNKVKEKKHIIQVIISVQDRLFHR